MWVAWRRAALQVVLEDLGELREDAQRSWVINWPSGRSSLLLHLTSIHTQAVTSETFLVSLAATLTVTT